MKTYKGFGLTKNENDDKSSINMAPPTDMVILTNKNASLVMSL